MTDTEDESAMTPFQRAQRMFQTLQSPAATSVPSLGKQMRSASEEALASSGVERNSSVAQSLESSNVKRGQAVDIWRNQQSKTSSDIVSNNAVPAKSPLDSWVKFESSTDSENPFSSPVSPEGATQKSAVDLNISLQPKPLETEQELPTNRGRPLDGAVKTTVVTTSQPSASSLNPFELGDAAADEDSWSEESSDGEKSPLRKSTSNNVFRDPLNRSQTRLDSKQATQSQHSLTAYQQLSESELNPISKKVTLAPAKEQLEGVIETAFVSNVPSPSKPALPPRPAKLLPTESTPSSPIMTTQLFDSKSSPAPKPPLPLRPPRLGSTMSNISALSGVTGISDVTQDSSTSSAARLRDRGVFYLDGIEANRRAPLSSMSSEELHLKMQPKCFASAKGFSVVGINGTVRIWDTQRAESILVNQAKSDAKVTALCFVPSMEVMNDGRFVWAGFNDGELWMIDSTTGDVLERRVSAHHYSILHILRFRRQLWTLDENGVLQIWFEPHPQSHMNDTYRSDIVSLEGRPKTLRLAPKQMDAVLVGAHLWTAGERYIEVVAPLDETSTFKKKIDAACGYGNLTAMAFTRNPLPTVSSPGSTLPFPYSLHDTSRYRVFTGHMDGKVVEWDATEFSKRRVFDMGSYRISCLLGVAERHLWVATGTGKILALDVDTHPAPMETPTVVKEWQAEVNDSVDFMVWDRDSLVHTGQMLVAGCSKNGHLHLWNAMFETDYIELEMKRVESEYCTYQDIELFIGSWNIDASKPEHLEARAEDTYLFDRWLAIAPPEGPDIIVFGFQEIVDLESKKIAAKGLLKNAAKKQESQTVIQQQELASRANLWRDRIIKALKDKFKAAYHLVDCRNLVGIFSCVFVKDEHQQHNLVRECFSHTVSTGLGGVYGNKGAIVNRFIFNDSSFCFIISHLPAHQTKVGKRNVDAITIIKSPGLPPVSDEEIVSYCFIRGGDGSQVLDHDYSFFFGDLNYRIDMDRDKVISLIDQGDWSTLRSADQLIRQRLLMNTTCLLRIYQESSLEFAPTYKYDPGTDMYDTSEKKRTPAWCDRILYRDGPSRIFYSAIDPSRRIKVMSPTFSTQPTPTNLLAIPSTQASRIPSSILSVPSYTTLSAPISPNIRQKAYKRFECKVSDHRPIGATFTVATKKVNIRQHSEVKQRILLAWKNRMNDVLQDAAIEWLMLRVDAVSSDAAAYRQRVVQVLNDNQGDLSLSIRALQS